MRPISKLGLTCLILVIAAIAQNASRPDTQHIGEAAFTVPANSFKEYPFSVPAGIEGCTGCWPFPSHRGGAQ
jgi:hypothetical protein